MNYKTVKIKNLKKDLRYTIYIHKCYVKCTSNYKNKPKFRTTFAWCQYSKISCNFLLLLPVGMEIGQSTTCPIVAFEIL